MVNRNCTAAALIALFALAAGCGDETMGPDRNWFVVGAASSSGLEPPVTVVVVDPLGEGNAASVTLNDVALQRRDPEDPIFSWESFDFSPGDTVVCSVTLRGETKRFAAIAPDRPTILAPADGSGIPTSAEISFQWSPVADVDAYFVSLLPGLGPTEVGPGTTEYRIPGSVLSPGFGGQTLSVSAASGSGMFLLDFLLQGILTPSTDAEDGFWIMETSGIEIHAGA